MPSDRPRPVAPPHDPVQVLVQGGFVDTEFVSAQLGRRLESPEVAARAVVESGDFAPHPLIDFNWLPRRRSWQRSGLHPIVWYVAERRRRNRLPTHPLADVRGIWQTTPEARSHPFGVLSYWLDLATETTPLPTGVLEHDVTWGDYRRAAIEAAHAWRADHARKRPRLAKPAPAPGPLPCVDVVLCARDQARLLRSTIASLQAQTHTDWHLYAVDAGSSDEGAAVLDGIAAFDDRITVVREGLLSPGAALNTGVRRGHGDLIAFLAPGRAWAPDHLERLAAHSVSGDIAFLQAGPGPTARNRTELLSGRSVDLTQVLVRRGVFDELDGFDELIEGAVARDLALRLTESHPLVTVDLGIERRPEPVAADRAGDDWHSLVLERHLIDWSTVSADACQADLASFVLPLSSDPRRTLDWFTATTVSDVERVAVGVRLPRVHHILAGSLARIVPNAQFVSTPADVNLNVALNLGICRARGATVVLVRPETMPPRVNVTAHLIGAVSEPGVAVAQPLVAAGDGTVLSAGARFTPGYDNPGLLLAGHPAEDAGRMGHSQIAAPASPLVVLPTRTAIALRGLNCRFGSVLAETELGLRARADGHGDSILVPSIVVTARGPYAEDDDLLGALATLRRDAPAPPPDNTAELLQRAGFEVTDLRGERLLASSGTTSASTLIPRPVVRAIDGIHESPPRLRWAIDIAAPAAVRGDRWGDTHFARSLANALTRRGQYVSVDRRDARLRDTRDHDDVLLVLRGLDRVEPRPGLLNVEWIISHPDMVAPDEVAGFDLVYAASVSWAAKASMAWGVPIEPLLQCTDSRLFHPDRGVPDTGPEVVFVGNSRGIYRFAVRTALAVGAPLTLHGNDWNEFVPPEMIASNGLANEDVGALYSSAGVVLNDHHLDMRRDSFASNRLFDAAACGARIVSDSIEGLQETFSGLVQTFRNEAELQELITAPYAAFPDHATRRVIAERIVAEHTFDRRAETLIDDATRLLLARR